MSTDAKFLSGSPLRHVTVMSFTASIGMMAIFAVDLIDMIFISMLGNDALAAAVGYAGTLLFFTTSISIGLSIAAGALSAKAIGAGNDNAAREYATSVALFGVLLSIIVAGLVLWFMRPILSLLGASGDVQDLAVSYLWIILPSMPIMVIAMVANAVLRAHGDARRSMLATLSAGITNAVLDPLFIFGFGLGLDGAAIASVFSRLAILFFSLYPALKVYNGFARPAPDLAARDARAVTSIAAPAILANVATPIGGAIVTREMSKFGTDAVAGMAIIGRLTPVAFAVVFALSGAVGPIIGQNYGAGLSARVRRTFWDAILFATVFVLFASAILYLFRTPIGAMFGATGLTLELVYLFCGPLALAYIFNGWIFVGNAAYNNLGHPFYSTWINWGRNTIGMYPFVIAGAALAGAKGVLIGQAVGGLIFAVVSMVIAQRLLGKEGSGTATQDFITHQRTHTVVNRHR